MKKSEIDSLVSEKKYDELIDKLNLEIDEDNEYSLLILCQCYCTIGNEKAAKKIAKRYRTLFPAGEYIVEVENILADVSKGIFAKKEDVPAGNIVNTLIKGKRERKIPDSINKCFQNYRICGMEEPKEKLSILYNQLRLQKEREQADFAHQTIGSTHFIISGGRGSGKTTLGKIIAELLYDFGLRSQNEVIMISPRKLMEVYENDHESGLSDFFQNNSDDTLLIENIQDIISEENQDTGVKAMLEKLREYMKGSNSSIIITGTEEAINNMLAIDNDIRDFVYEIIKIDKYSNMDLLQILRKISEKKGFLVSDSSDKVLLRKIGFESKSSKFMNAISLERMIKEAIKKMSMRYSQSDDDSDASLVTLMPEDFSDNYEDESIEELLAELDGMIGLENVKAQIRKIVNNVQAQISADDAGASREVNHGTLHMLFTGNPGTGKTTIATLVGKIYQQLNLLPNGGQIVYCTRSDLVAGYQGQSAIQVKNKFKEAEGGILFIDEAYSLFHGKGDTFGQEAVDEIIAQMENRRDTMMVILAGYKKEMEDFLRESNSGWSSRIKDTIVFDDYSVEEMVGIFEGMVKSQKMKTEKNIDQSLTALIEEKTKTPDFGNARGVRKLFEDVLSAQSERIVSIKQRGETVSKDDYDTITLEDIESILQTKTIGEKTLDDLLNEIDSVTGLASAKKAVHELVDSVQVNKYLEEIGENVERDFGTLHMLFKGNAGTGKTTVARLIGQIYVKLGVLKKNTFVEVGRKDLVAEFQGQTAPKVISCLDRADGGILFIDEAYSLSNGERDDFGHEAINTLVPELENRREHLMVIVAGYSDMMDTFLEANQGLASRLSKEIIFEDYTVEEMVTIFKIMAENKGLALDTSVSDEVISKAIIKKKSEVKDFANGRGVRNMLDKAILCKNARVAAVIRSGRKSTAEEINTIIQQDLEV